MAEFVKLIWDICCLRRGPQDLPYAPALLALVCAIALGFQGLVSLDATMIAIGAVTLAIKLCVLYALLFVRNLRNRFVQSATALQGCALMIGLLILPLSLMVGDPKDTQVSSGRGLIALAILLLLSWNLIIQANIFRHSLNVPFMTGMMVAVSWFIVELYALRALAPAVPTS